MTVYEILTLDLVAVTFGVMCGFIIAAVLYVVRM